MQETAHEILRSCAGAPATISPKERLQIVTQALRLLEENYVHLMLKREVHGVDPVRRMQRLLRTLEQSPGLLDDDEFHRAMIRTLTPARDRHLAYLLPACWADYHALLGFTLGEIRENGRRLYIVDELTRDLGDAEFVPGVEVTSWSGVAMRRAVLKSGDFEAGTTRDARRALGLESLTSRAVMWDGIPEENWIVVGYRNRAGSPREVRVEWKLVPKPPPVSMRVAEPDLDTRLDSRQQMRRALSRERRAAVAPAGAPYRRIETVFGDLETFEARAYGSGEKAFGYIRIRKFQRNNVLNDDFLNAFIKLLKHEDMPPKRLVLDIRDNPGGNIAVAERMLQTLTDRRPIEPATFQFRNTQSNLELCRSKEGRDDGLEPWIESIELGLKSGAPYSDAIPKTDVKACNKMDRIYPGSSVLLTDARSYSAAEFFAAGFQDHKIGPILGVHARTGGGGANVWNYEGKFCWFLPDKYPSLAAGISFNVAMRRSLRVGPNAGKLLEEEGVEADKVQELTRNDVLLDDIDIITKAASMIGTGIA